MTDGRCADDVTVLRLREAQHRHRNTLQILTSLARKRSRQSQNRQVRENLAYFAEIVEIFAHLDRQASDGHRAPIVSRLNAMSRRWQILGNGHVEVVLEADDGLALPTSDETVVCLIVHECVLNAFKHAFPDGRRGRIHVQLSRPTDSTVRLSIEDDGVGMSQDATEPRPDAHRSKKLGSSLVSSLAEALAGTVTWDKGKSDGTCVVVQLNTR